jgi:SAM-dependent methyltransferase
VPLASEAFAPDWLALREPIDHRSRADELVAPLAEWWLTRGGARITDLGSGTGSNLRYLAPLLAGSQEWTLVDQDDGLLARALELGVASVPGVGRVERVRGDLAHEGLAAARRADLVTASALLDLVSETWVRQLVETCAKTRCAALFALSWDGEITWGGDPDPDDALVLDAVRAHQLRDKGMGPALGPAAGEVVTARFGEAGFLTSTGQSPWKMGADDRALALALLEGWARAAFEQTPEEEQRIHAWTARRRETLAGDFALTVGHLDVLALPPAS